jgi:hypothetical protein
MEYSTFCGRDALGVHYPMTYHLGKPFITTFGIGSVWEYGRKSTHNLRQQVRKRLEKTDNPTAGIIDSQSVKTAEKRGKCTVTMVANGSKDASDLSSLIP